jgi:2-polyprenyl-6-methoxyphenol hydroxylase-like FAD-dependent oxidoreductase
MQTDVLIVGAGPTGLALANQLTRFGVDFVILDKREGTTPYSKAIGVHARTLEIYDQMGIADDLIALGTPAAKARMFAGGSLRGEVEFGELGKGMSPFPFILFVEQGLHEKVLNDRLLDLGKEVRWRTNLLDFEQGPSVVTARVQKTDGTVETIAAKYLVGCDGAKSPVRHALRLKFEGSTFERVFYVADVELDWKFGYDALQVFLMRSSLLAFFPMKGERQYRIVGTFPEEFSKDEGDVLYEEIEEQIKQDADLELDITHVNWFSTYKVHTRHVERFSSGRCFLAGDAAHIHTPAGAQGMNTGIQDGYNLAWKLAYVLKYGSDPRLLETYNEERLPNAEALMKTTDRFFNLAAGKNVFLALARLYVFPYVAQFLFSLNIVNRFVFPRISQIAINYRGSSLGETQGRFAVKAGDRMPWLEIDGRSIYDDLRAPMFQLLIFSEDSVAIPPLPPEMLQNWNGRIDSHFYPLNETAKKAFGCDRPFFVILRPDNYIGLISDDLSPSDVAAYLAKFN